MFYRIDTTNQKKELDYKAIALAGVFLFIIMLAAFVAFKIGFTDAVTPLLTIFTTGAGGVFGALLGEGAKI